MAIALGTIYGSIRLQLDGLTGDAQSVKSIFQDIRDSIASTFTDANPVAPLEEDLAGLDEETAALADEINANMASAGEAFAQLGTDATAGMDEVDASVTDGTAAAGDSVAGFSDRVSSLFSSLGEKFSGFADAADAGLGRVADAGDAAGSALGSGIGAAVGGLGGIFHGALGHVVGLGAGLLEFEAIAGTTQAVSGFVGNLIGMNTQFEKLHAQLTSITGSSGTADKIMTWIKQFGQEVPDTTEHLAEATVTIQSLGLNAEQVVPSIADVAAAMGQTLPVAARAFSDAYEGRFMMLQNDLHISKQQLEQFGLEVNKQGHVLNNSLVPAFEKLAQSKFGNSLKNQMGTLQGQLSNLTDRVQFFAMQLGAPLFNLAKQGLGKIFDFLDSHKAQINAFATIVGTTLAGAFKFLGNIISKIPQFLQSLGDHFQKAFNSGNRHQIDSLKNGLQDAGQVIQHVGTWIQQNFVPTMQHLADGAGTVAGKIAGFVQFLQTHEAAMDGFKAALAAIAVVIAVNLIAAFIGWAIAAGSAAVATIAATWPILAIIAAIAALIFIIILVVQHWGDITKAIGNFLGTVGHAIGDFFKGLGTLIHDGLMRAQLAWNAFIVTVQGIIKRGFQTILDIITAPIRFVEHLFNWLFNHNYYFHNLVEAIITEFNRAKAFISTVWNDIVGFVTGIWTHIVDFAKDAWHKLTTTIQMEIAAAQLIISTIWNKVVSFLQGIWTTVKTDAQTAWDNFVGIISNIISKVTGAVNNVVSAITAPIVGLGKQALQWGQNLIQQFINGIKAMAGKVGDAAKGIAHNVAKFLGFHSPAEEGPGADADTWGPNLVKMVSAGIESGAPGAQTSASKVAQAYRAGFFSQNGSLALGGAQLATGTVNLAAGLPATGNGADSSKRKIDHLVVNLTVQVAPEPGDGTTPTAVGQQFGKSLGDALVGELTRNGYTD